MNAVVSLADRISELLKCDPFSHVKVHLTLKYCFAIYISHILLINSPFYTNNNYSFIHTYIQESFILWDICGWNLILVGEGWYLLFNVDTLYIVHYCRWFSNNSTLNWSSTQQQRDVISWQAAELFGVQIRRCHRFLIFTPAPIRQAYFHVFKLSL